VIGERRLRSEDMRSPERPYSIRLGASGATGKEIRHYPDLLLVDPRGRRVALELELSRKEIPRREAILAGYGADRRLDAVVYFVERNLNGQRLGRTIASEAARMGISDRVHLRRFPPIGLDGREERGPRELGPSRGRRRGTDTARAEAGR
jgi:hypothetical protein